MYQLVLEYTFDRPGRFSKASCHLEGKNSTARQGRIQPEVEGGGNLERGRLKENEKLHLGQDKGRFSCQKGGAKA